DQLLGVGAALVVGQHAGGGRGGDHAGDHHVAADVGGGALGGGGAAEVDHCGFGRRVAGHPGGAEQAADRRQVDDGTAALLLHQAHRGAGAPEGAVHGGGEVAVPGGGVGAGDGAPAVGHGVVDQDVQATVALGRRLDGGDEGLLVTDVGDHALGVAALVADRRDHRFQRLGA